VKSDHQLTYNTGPCRNAKPDLFYKIPGNWFCASVAIEPLALFRILFGLMMLIGTLRFIGLGWIDDQLLNPAFHFTYYGFAWVKPFGRELMYAWFFLMAAAACGIMLGWHYRLSAVIFFVTFTYAELIDKTYYLNHYYFIVLASFLLCCVPAAANYSLDAFYGRVRPRSEIPAWTINLIRFQIGLVYVYAGLAKLNYSWLIEAMPLRIWLPAQNHWPLLGSLMEWHYSPWLFSWAGAFYDLLIPFVLASRFWAWGFAANILFHALTGLFFQIGMFPAIMVLAVPVFFPLHVQQKILQFLPFRKTNSTELKEPISPAKPLIALILLYIIFQLLFPFRYVFYPGNRFWTEEGYRFGWRVMLMEKAGYATFYVRDGLSGREGAVDNREFLNAHQEKQMSMQPDMILEYAHFLGEYFRSKGVKNPSVRAEVYVTMNGRPSRLFIDSSANLLDFKDDWKPKKWILPFEP